LELGDGLMVVLEMVAVVCAIALLAGITLCAFAIAADIITTVIKRWR
jgi:hypothetical protein